MSPKWAGIPGKETLVPGLSVPDKADLELPEKIKGNFLEVEGGTGLLEGILAYSLTLPSLIQASI